MRPSGEVQHAARRVITDIVASGTLRLATTRTRALRDGGCEAARTRHAEALARRRRLQRKFQTRTIVPAEHHMRPARLHSPASTCDGHLTFWMQKHQLQ